MIGKIAKLVAYKKKPKATFALLHPVKTAKFIGAGLVALPIGLWVGKKAMGRS